MRRIAPCSRPAASRSKPDGTIFTERVLADANWAELAGGAALLCAGAALIAIAIVKANRARKLQASW